MTNIEFAEVMGYVGAGCGKELSPASQLVYFDLLGDLQRDLLMTAAKRVLAEHRWSTFPSIAELRQAAVESMYGEIKELSGGEAWSLAWKAVGRIDLEVDGSKERALKGLPPIVAESLNAMGLANLIGGNDPVGVLRGQFLKVFEQLQARDRRLAIMPAAVREAITNNAQSPPVAGRLADSFRLPE